MKTKIDASQPGFVFDIPDAILPDGAWTEGRNFRCREGALEKVKGAVNVFNSASATIIWVEPVSDGLTTFWVYGNESVLYATDGSLHQTASSISYTPNLDIGYTGGAFQGFMIANDGTNPPQVWIPALGNKFQGVSHWPASTLCDVIRPFGKFLVALKITESGTYNPRLIRWSDAAAAGAMPQSWDYTDPTNQSGRTELGQTYDQLVDCLALRDANIVYKQFHTWTMNYIGGLDVFQFREVFKESGLLAANCAKAFGPRHFVVSDNDVIVHDGNDAQSIADKRLRRWLFNKISTTTFLRSFVAPDYRDREMWFCFPEEGHNYPNLAAVWNWIDDTWSVRELGEEIGAASTGIVEASGVTFDNDPGNFTPGPYGEFDEYEYTPWSQRLLLGSAIRPQLLQGNAGYTWAGLRVPAYAARTHMALTMNVDQQKWISRILPYIKGREGDVVRFRVGSAEQWDGTVRFTPWIDYTIGEAYKIDVRPFAGRHMTLYLEHTATATVRLLGFDVEFAEVGGR